MESAVMTQGRINRPSHLRRLIGKPIKIRHAAGINITCHVVSNLCDIFYLLTFVLVTNSHLYPLMVELLPQTLKSGLGGAGFQFKRIICDFCNKIQSASTTRTDEQRNSELVEEYNQSKWDKLARILATQCGDSTRRKDTLTDSYYSIGRQLWRRRRNCRSCNLSAAGRRRIARLCQTIESKVGSLTESL